MNIKVGGTFGHPIHTHGMYWKCMEAGTLAQLNSGGNPAYQNINRRPPLKDVIMIPPGGYVRNRIYTDNPGYWYVHCHIELHMELGMRLTMKIGKDKDMVPPPKHFPKCGNFNADVRVCDDHDEDEDHFSGRENYRSRRQ